MGIRFFKNVLRENLCALCILSLFSAQGCSDRREIPEGYLPQSGSLMFSEPEGLDIYNYCPSVFEERGVRHIYYCSNVESGTVKDYIAYRRGVFIGGAWYYGEKQLVLSPTPGSFDEMHTCDPSVIKGSFSYKGESYSYLMAYLGCVTTDNQRNEVGLAVAKAPQGPWIKTESVNPIVPHLNFDPERTDVFQWGYGQPSLISADNEGKVILSYTMGTVSEGGIRVELWDFSSLDQPGREYSADLTIAGITLNNSSEQTFAMANADIAYDPKGGRLFLVGDSHPFASEGEPTFVASASYVGYIPCPGLLSHEDGAPFPSSFATWSAVAFLGSDVSGYPRNHNSGLITDEYGRVSPGTLRVAYTVSETGKPFYSLWTYRIHEAEFPVE